MSELFVLYHSFTDAVVANEIATRIKDAGLELEFDIGTAVKDKILIGSNLEPEFKIKLQSKDFARANAVLEDYYTAQLQFVEKDYYLYSFTNTELLEIIEKRDEWGIIDYVLAKKILAENGVDISKAAIQKLDSDRLQQVAQPEALSTSWILLGYLGCLIIGIFGIFYAIAIVIAKKTLPNGLRVYTYNKATRSHGTAMIVVAIFMIALVVTRILMKR